MEIRNRIASCEDKKNRFRGSGGRSTIRPATSYVAGLEPRLATSRRGAPARPRLASPHRGSMEKSCGMRRRCAMVCATAREKETSSSATSFTPASRSAPSSAARASRKLGPAPREATQPSTCENEGQRGVHVKPAHSKHCAIPPLCIRGSFCHRLLKRADATLFRNARHARREAARTGTRATRTGCAACGGRGGARCGC